MERGRLDGSHWIVRALERVTELCIVESAFVGLMRMEMTGLDPMAGQRRKCKVRVRYR